MMRAKGNFHLRFIPTLTAALSALALSLPLVAAEVYPRSAISEASGSTQSVNSAQAAATAKQKAARTNQYGAKLNSKSNSFTKMKMAKVTKAQGSVKVPSKVNFKSKGGSLALVNTSQFQIDKPKAKSEESNFSGSAEISRSTSLYDLKNGSKYDGMDYLVAVSYKLPTGSVSSRLSYSQDLNDETGENSSINDTNLTYSHKSDILMKDASSAVISWSPSFTALVPLSERTQKVEQLQTALIGSVSLKILAGDTTSLSGAGLSLSLSAGQNFHRFESDVNGTILNKNSSNQSLAAFYTLGDFTFTVSFANKIRWPYSGDVRQSFELSEDITYSFLKVWSVSFGHTNAGSALKPNGYDSNISLIDDDNSLIYLGLAYGF